MKLNKPLFVCWSIRQAEKKLRMIPPCPQIMHIQGESGKTVCGIDFAGLFWQTDIQPLEQRINALCKKCAKGLNDARMSKVRKQI